MQDTPQTQPAYLPENNRYIRIVDSFGAMCGDDFAGDENVLLLPRRLNGAFNALALRLSQVKSQQREALLESFVGPRLHVLFGAAASQVQGDMNALRDHGFQPELRVVTQGYYIPTVMNYHVDRALSRIICCYNGQATEFLNNEDAEHQNPDRATGAFWAKAGAAPQNFQLGDIWRHKGVPLNCSGEIDMRAAMAAAFIHRAPKMRLLSVPRLMVVGEVTAQPLI
jgi:hypothetical protein